MSRVVGESLQSATSCRELSAQTGHEQFERRRSAIDMLQLFASAIT